MVAWFLPALGSALLGKAVDEILEDGGAITKTGTILAHKGEFVLPANAKPTAQQKRIVKQNKLKRSKMKVKAPKKAPKKAPVKKKVKRSTNKLKYV